MRNLKKKKKKKKKSLFVVFFFFFFFFFLSWHVRGLSSQRIALKVDWYTTGKYTVCRRFRASFSPEILQAVAVKGLITLCITWSAWKDAPFRLAGQKTYLQAEASCRDVSLCLVAEKPTGIMGYVVIQIETYRMAEASCRDVSFCLGAGKATGTMGYVPGQIETYRLAEASCRDV